jgi:hypothetical protein
MGQRRLQTEKPQSLRISVEKIRRKKEIKENIFVCVIKIWFLFLFLFILCVCVCVYLDCVAGATRLPSPSQHKKIKMPGPPRKFSTTSFLGIRFIFYFLKVVVVVVGTTTPSFVVVLLVLQTFLLLLAYPPPIFQMIFVVLAHGRFVHFLFSPPKK